MAIFPSPPFLTLSEAAQILPKAPSEATIYRWAKSGIKGATLNTYKVGRQRVTTIRDVLKFIADLNGVELLVEDVENYYRTSGIEPVDQVHFVPRNHSPDSSPETDEKFSDEEDGWENAKENAEADDVENDVEDEDDTFPDCSC